MLYVTPQLIDAIHTVLSEGAVHLRGHRIMQRLQDAALAIGAKMTSRTGAVPRDSCRPDKKSGTSMKGFSLKGSVDFLPISKSRRQLSLDFSPASGEGQ
jgi:hypothetical protein